MEPIRTQIFLIACLTTLSSISASPNTTAKALCLPQDINSEGPPISPFLGMRMKGGALEVQVDNATWYALVSIEKIESKTLVAQSHKLCGNKWWKRLREDLPALLTAMGHDAGATVDLRVRDLKTKKVLELKDVAMTREKRNGMRGGGRVLRILPAAMARSQFIIVDAALEDLDQFVSLLDDKFAYRHRLNINLDALVKAAKKRLMTGNPTHREFLEELDLILKAFGDGHSRFSKSPNRPESTGYTPFVLVKTKGGYAAINSNRLSLVDPKHPYVIEIEGRPIKDWIELGRKHVTQGSPQYQDRSALRSLRFHNEQRRLFSLPADDDLKLVFSGKDGIVRRKLDLVDRVPFYGKWPRTQTRRLADGIGYLRIARMERDPDVLRAIDVAMQGFRDTTGLIIDVRSNGGGTRDILRRLFPYFMSKTDSPHVANIAAYRLPGGLGDPMKIDGYLSNRGLYPMSWRGWSAEQRKAIAIAQRQFKPTWQLPSEGFSAWHYFVLDRSDNPAAYHYRKPVVVLMDGGCFSATDIFLGAFKGQKGVSLIGSASGGGSGRTQSHKLSTGIRFRISSMASFRPDGRLYEGLGIHPDLEIVPIATDFILGGTDTTLERAIEELGR